MIELYSSKMSVPGLNSAELSDIAIDSLLKDRVNESVLSQDPINLRLYNIGTTKSSERE